MKPPAFKYVRVRSVEEALAALSRHGVEAKILAGGQSLVPMMNFRLAYPQVLVDINPVRELDYIKVDNGRIRIGATTRQRSVERSDQVKKGCPILAEGVKWIGHPQIRNRGTVGGSLVHGDPSAELALIATLLDAEFVIQGADKPRRSNAAEFFADFMTTQIAEGEILTEVSYPTAPPRSGWGFQELCIRHGDFAIVAAAVQITLDAQGRCREVRVAVGGAGPKPLRIRGAEKALVGSDGGADALAAAAACVPDEVDPTGDFKGNEAYRRAMARVFVRRSLDQAWAMAKRS
jgi:CO/xanthine dehydrogenase FAD-binding subunit